MLLLGDISVEFFFFYSHRGKSFRHKFCKYLTEIRSPKPAHILFLTNCQSISGFFISERAFQSCFSRLYLIITVIIVVNEREMHAVRDAVRSVLLRFVLLVRKVMKLFTCENCTAIGYGDNMQYKYL